MESLGVARAPNDLEASPLLRGGAGGLVVLIAGVGGDHGQPREPATNAMANLGQSASILDVGGVDNRLHQQAVRVYKDVALLAFDPFARVKAGRINRAPPFSAPLTL